MNLVGIIESGKFKGRKILLGKEGKIDKNASEWWIESGKFANGAPKFVRACLKCGALNIAVSGHKCKKH